MIVKADVEQLVSDNVFFNIKSDTNYAGVFTNKSYSNNLIFEAGDTLWFLQFKNSENKDEYKAMHPGLKIIYETEA